METWGGVVRGGSGNLNNSAQWGLHNIISLEQHWHSIPGVRTVLAKSTSHKTFAKAQELHGESKSFVICNLRSHA